MNWLNSSKSMAPLLLLSKSLKTAISSFLEQSTPSLLKRPDNSSIERTPLLLASKVLKMFLNKYSSWLPLASVINLCLIRATTYIACFWWTEASSSSQTSQTCSIIFTRFSSFGCIMAPSRPAWTHSSFEIALLPHLEVILSACYFYRRADSMHLASVLPLPDGSSLAHNLAFIAATLGLNLSRARAQTNLSKLTLSPSSE